MDIGRSFTYVTEDKDWITKVLVGAVIMLASAVLSIVIIGLVGYLLLFGYYVEVIRRVHAGVPTPLPDWTDLGSYISRGFFAAVGAIVWTLPIIALTFCGVIFDTALGGDGGSILLIGALCLAVPIGIALNVLVVPLAIARYAVSGEFGSMFEFGEIFAQARKVFVPLLITFVVSLAVYAVAYFGLIACIVGIFFTLQYAYLVHAFLIGDMYRQADNSIVPTAQAAF